MNQQQPYHLYLLNQQPRKSILKTSASQVGVPKVSKTASFLREEQSEPPQQTKSFSFGANQVIQPIPERQQQQQSESNRTKNIIGFSSQTTPLNSANRVSLEPSPIGPTQVILPSSASSTLESSQAAASFFYKPTPSLLFQSLIETLPLKPNDVSTQSKNQPSSLMEYSTNNSSSSSNISTTSWTSNNNTTANSSFTQPTTTIVQSNHTSSNTTCNNNNTECQPLVFQRMSGASSLLSLFPSIQKETTQDTKMSQQQVGRQLSSSSDNLASHSLINGGVMGLSNQSNMFKRDYSKAIRQFQNQTTNQFIQRTIASNLDNIQKNRPNIASDRSFLEGMELGMQLNGFLNKLTRDSKDYVKELLDDVARRTTQSVPSQTIVPVNISSPILSTIPTTSTTNTSSIAVTSPTNVDTFVQSSVQNIMQKGQEQAFQTQFVRKCMNEAISRALHSSQH